MTLGAWAKATSRIRLGLLVGANTFRNPGLVAKLATTLDHISDGRAILGLGGAWFDYEHERHGIDFGTECRPAPGLDGRVGRRPTNGARRRLGHVARWRPLPFDDLRQEPLPVQRTCRS